jgi:hypothetical protein
LAIRIEPTPPWGDFVRNRIAAARESAHHAAQQAPGHPQSVAIENPPREGAADPDLPFEEGAHDEIDADLRHRLISAAAFDLYAKRGFVDGFDLDDWLSAEANVDHFLLNPQYR